MGDVLKPCPFCGDSKAATVYIRDGRKVFCPCGASGKQCFHGPLDQPNADERAITAWNTRADDGCIAELVALVIQYRDDLRRPPNADSVERRLEAITAALINITTAERKGCDTDH